MKKFFSQKIVVVFWNHNERRLRVLWRLSAAVLIFLIIALILALAAIPLKDVPILNWYLRRTRNHKYFFDMDRHFIKMSKLLKPDAHYVMVVGNSRVSNIMFDTSSYLTQLAREHGLQLMNKWGYRIKNRYMRFDRKGRGGLIKLDWVLDFKLD